MYHTLNPKELIDERVTDKPINKMEDKY